MQLSGRNLLITGANGFLGTRLDRLSSEAGWLVRRALRRPDGKPGVVVGEVGPNTDWSEALKEVGAVVHLAARVHMMSDSKTDTLSEYRKVNVEGTTNLARQAVRAGVQRFIFLSSIKVNGETSEPGRPFSPDDPPKQQDPYGVSKYEAEHALRRISEESGLEVVVIRPPMVYGPGVKANFLRLLKLVNASVPLPFGAVRNNRSLVAIDNLVDLILICLEHHAAAGRTFLVSDGQDMSTPDLIRKIAGAMGRPARLFPVPPVLLRFAGRVVGLAADVERLTGSLQVDIRDTCRILEWQPPVGVDEAVRETASDFLSRFAPHKKKKGLQAAFLI